MSGYRRLIPLILIPVMLLAAGTAAGQPRTGDSDKTNLEKPTKPEKPSWEQKEPPVRDTKEKPVLEEEGQPPKPTGAQKRSKTKSKVKRGQGVTPKKKSWGFDSDADTSGSPLGPTLGPAIGPQGSAYPDRDSRSNPFKDKDKK
jgi:hypothetical protein